MQFNTYGFLLCFLPCFLFVYFLCGRVSKNLTKYIIIIGGVFFYLYAGIESFAVLIFSIVINYSISYAVEHIEKNRKPLLVIAIIVNIIILVVFKYINFAIISINAVFNCSFAERHLFLPLGVSFFTFQQIMYVVNVYRGNIHTNMSDYLAYIFYFPKLIMGPIIEPCELISQINDDEKKLFNTNNMAAGLKMLSFGLFKKMMLADTFEKAVAWAYGNLNTATSFDLIMVILFYSFEIYFDFSGYIDMATGVSKMLNIELPINFDSPYKSASIREFWKRWHISLTSFFTNYLYIPMGGSRNGHIRTYINVLIVFLISGLWHGANWTFVVWGGCHGILSVAERVFEKYFKRIPVVVRVIYTFSIVSILWSLFRSDSIKQWIWILSRIFQFQNCSVSKELIEAFIIPERTIVLDILHMSDYLTGISGLDMMVFLIASFVICMIPSNNYRMQEKKTCVNMIFAAIAFILGFLCLSTESVFVYNGF